MSSKVFVCVSAFRVTPKKPGHELPPSGEATASIEAGPGGGGGVWEEAAAWE